MGFLDDIKSRFPLRQNHAADSYGDSAYDDYYDEDAAAYGDDSYQGASDAYGRGSYRSDYGADQAGNGMLGQTRRGEAESVAVYTRSGELVGDADRHASTYTPPAREGAYRPGAYDTPSSVAAQTQRTQAAAVPAAAPASDTAARVSAVMTATPQLPAYVLRPTVREVGDRVFIVLPQGCEIKETDLAKLRQDGFLKQ